MLTLCDFGIAVKKKLNKMKSKKYFKSKKEETIQKISKTLSVLRKVRKLNTVSMTNLGLLYQGSDWPGLRAHITCGPLVPIEPRGEQRRRRCGRCQGAMDRWIEEQMAGGGAVGSDLGRHGNGKGFVCETVVHVPRGRRRRGGGLATVVASRAVGSITSRNRAVEEV